MIKMIKGAYGLKINGVVEAMTSRSAPFSLADAREAELVAAGVAVYVQSRTWTGVQQNENGRSSGKLLQRMA